MKRMAIFAALIAAPVSAQTTTCIALGGGFVTCTTTPSYSAPLNSGLQQMMTNNVNNYAAMREQQTMLELQRQREAMAAYHATKNSEAQRQWEARRKAPF